MQLRTKHRSAWFLMLAGCAVALFAAGTAAPPVTQPASPATAAAKRPLPPGPFPLEPSSHDPVMVKDGDFYYTYWTGGGINAARSRDLVHWDRLPPVFSGGAGRRGPATIQPAAATPMPAWIAREVTGVNGLWAPDISFWAGKWHMYYAGSSFGKNTSVIGQATNATLDPADPKYRWVDEGLVIESKASDNYNCIDPNVVLDDAGKPWLTFGSFWTGIKLVKLDPATGQRDAADPTIYPLAQRPNRGAIEAPFIVRHDKYYYLFVSFDACCNGLRSTYRVMVGRAEKLTGPYLDQTGTDMRKGGGTQLLAGDGKRIVAPGHNAVLQDQYGWLFVCHFLDANTNGTARLRVQEMTWGEKGWPVLGKVINAAGGG